jgi:hypothetical protein
MSSGFVSGGTDDKPVKRSDEWIAAHQEIEANRQSKAFEARQSDGRSLYETLQANKGTPRLLMPPHNLSSVRKLITQGFVET